MVGEEVKAVAKFRNQYQPVQYPHPEVLPLSSCTPNQRLAHNRSTSHQVTGCCDVDEAEGKQGHGRHMTSSVCRNVTSTAAGLQVVSRHLLHDYGFSLELRRAQKYDAYNVFAVTTSVAMNNF